MYRRPNRQEDPGWMLSDHPCFSVDSFFPFLIDGYSNISSLANIPVQIVLRRAPRAGCRPTQNVARLTSFLEDRFAKQGSAGFRLAQSGMSGNLRLA